MDVLKAIGIVATPGNTKIYSLAAGNWVWDSSLCHGHLPSFCPSCRNVFGQLLSPVSMCVSVPGALHQVTKGWLLIAAPRQTFCLQQSELPPALITLIGIMKAGIKHVPQSRNAGAAAEGQTCCMWVPCGHSCHQVQDTSRGPLGVQLSGKCCFQSWDWLFCIWEYQIYSLFSWHASLETEAVSQLHDCFSKCGPPGELCWYVLAFYSLIAAEIPVWRVLNPNSAKYLSKYILLYKSIVTLISATLLTAIITCCTEAKTLSIPFCDTAAV